MRAFAAVSLLLLLLLALARHAYAAGCPMAGASAGQPMMRDAVAPMAVEGYAEAVAALNLAAVKSDLNDLMTDSQAFWPADYGHYGPLFIRLAWHCAGSYRASDGRGGCDGGRIRFYPERSWMDNTNLDKALELLAPIKIKYGLGLSWGDLITLAGTVAIESMGGPVLGFCAGRIDDMDGDDSQLLGPTPEQEALYACITDGDCQPPLGPTTLGLIYVNPEGPFGNPIPEESAPQSRDTFARMGMDDRETVALIGGGHAFGKTHGPCPDGPGPNPMEQPEDPWPGMCGSGRGADTFTSGFEGAWTPDPIVWNNDYFVYLLQFENEWALELGPGGHYIWRAPNSPMAPLAHGGGSEPIIMLTSDVALLTDPEYHQIVEEFEADPDALDVAFAAAWYKLVTRDMGPHSRCLGSMVPPPQPWQVPLPPTPDADDLADFDAVRSDLLSVVSTYGEELVNLAWRCASTYRYTDYQGGCDGARIRFPPESGWPENAGAAATLPRLDSVKAKYGDGLSWADLIVLAGTMALEQELGIDQEELPFCPGRTDADMGVGGSPDDLRTVVGVDETLSELQLKNAGTLLGLNTRELVATLGVLSGRKDAADWLVLRLHESASGTDALLKYDPELRAVAEAYAEDGALYKADAADAWTRLMNANRWDGPTRNPCDAMGGEGDGNGGSPSPPSGRPPAYHRPRHHWRSRRGRRNRRHWA